MIRKDKNIYRLSEVLSVHFYLIKGWSSDNDSYKNEWFKNLKLTSTITNICNTLKHLWLTDKYIHKLLQACFRKDCLRKHCKTSRLTLKSL